jgi:triosephosphate isomerase
MKNKLIIGNWKMNGSIALLDDFISLLEGTEVILGIPSIFIAYAKFKSCNLKIASQDCSIFNGFGKCTGEISCQMLANIGVRYSIIGHSERRSLGLDSTDDILKKLSNATDSGLTAIYCVGEDHTDLTDQRTASLINEAGDKIIVAYEPVSAIGTGKPQSVPEIYRNISIIKDRCSEALIVYGGSVDSKNAEEILGIDEVDGILIGGASLNTQEMQDIMSFTQMTKLE